MAAKPKRVHARKGQKHSARQSRGTSRRNPAMFEQRQVRNSLEGNGHEDLVRAESVEQPPEAVAQFARMASEQVKQSSTQRKRTDATTQVLGWASRVPAKQIENMMGQMWKMGENGGSSRYMRALAQANVEMVGLVGRRSKAYFDLPAHLAQCRTPQQMWDEQTRFLQDMLLDYQVTNDRMVNCWVEAASPDLDEAHQETKKT